MKLKPGHRYPRSLVHGWRNFAKVHHIQLKRKCNHYHLTWYKWPITSFTERLGNSWWSTETDNRHSKEACQQNIQWWQKVSKQSVCYTGWKAVKADLNCERIPSSSRYQVILLIEKKPGKIIDGSFQADIEERGSEEEKKGQTLKVSWGKMKRQKRKDST